MFFLECSFFTKEQVLFWLPWWLRWLSVCLQCRRPGFNPWVGKIPWRRERQPTPVLLPGNSHGQRSLVGYSPRGCKESDTTEQLHFLSFLLRGWFLMAFQTKQIFSCILGRNSYMKAVNGCPCNQRGYPVKLTSLSHWVTSLSPHSQLLAETPGRNDSRQTLLTSPAISWDTWQTSQRAKPPPPGHTCCAVMSLVKGARAACLEGLLRARLSTKHAKFIVVFGPGGNHAREEPC